MIPSNIVGPTDTLHALVETTHKIRGHICDNTRDPSMHAYCVGAFAQLACGIESAARTIDALNVQLAEARGLLLQRDHHPVLSAVQKREIAEHIASKCGFELPKYYPFKTMEEALADMGISIHDLSDLYAVDDTQANKEDRS